MTIFLHDRLGWDWGGRGLVFLAERAHRFDRTALTTWLRLNPTAMLIRGTVDVQFYMSTVT
jgi:hypothetical protein